jgi:4-amino-4-deoxy-L-arabinose transferase-like glycosyltransferase
VTTTTTRPTAPETEGPTAGGGPTSTGDTVPAGRGRLLRGRPDDPAWARPALLALLLATGVLYLWDLSASGWANSFYSAAVQAGSKSWEAFFFGSSDAANAITVDKPPASLWVMTLSVRAFGLSSWSILVPQALMGVATVGVLYAAVRRRASASAALLAGAALALTPVAALMFRFNNPDALLTLLMTVAAYLVLRAVESGRMRWLVWAGVLLGLGFLTKQLQVFLVLPGMALAYLVAAPVGIWRRVRDLLLGGLAMVGALGWWVAVVELTPARYRPYIGGSQTNSILELTLGYNGLGRITGNETGSVTPGGGNAGGNGGMWGQTGLFRMFTGESGGQVSWLLPGALLLALGGFWLLRRAPRTDPTRAALIMWTGWTVVTALVFSFMAGIYHDYYTVALAPGIAGMVGTGAWVAWKRREQAAAAVTLGLATAVTGVWGYVLLARSSDWHPWLRWLVLGLGLVAGAGLFLAGHVGPRVRMALASTAVVAALAGPLGYTLNTVTTAHQGSIVTAGPRVAGAGFGPGGGRGGFPGGGPGGMPPGTSQNGQALPGTGQAPGQAPGQTQGGTGQQGGPGGGMGGLLNGTTPSAALVSALEQDASSYTWVAAAVGANNASGYQLATELPVMAIGGFNGSDPSPTLAQFKQYVAEGRIHYFIGGGGFGGANGGSSSSSEIAAWVQSTYTATTVGGTTLYDLSSATTA